MRAPERSRTSCSQLRAARLQHPAGQSYPGHEAHQFGNLAEGQEPLGVVQMPDAGRHQARGRISGGQQHMSDWPTDMAADLVKRGLHGRFDRGGLVGRHRHQLQQPHIGGLLPQAFLSLLAGRDV